MCFYWFIMLFCRAAVVALGGQSGVYVTHAFRIGAASAGVAAAGFDSADIWTIRRW